jgi:hypothetical protein
VAVLADKTRASISDCLPNRALVMVSILGAFLATPPFFRQSSRPKIDAMTGNRLSHSSCTGAADDSGDRIGGNENGDYHENSTARDRACKSRVTLADRAADEC